MSLFTMFSFSPDYVYYFKIQGPKFHINQLISIVNISIRLISRTFLQLFLFNNRHNGVIFISNQSIEFRKVNIHSNFSNKTSQIAERELMAQNTLF